MKTVELNSIEKKNASKLLAQWGYDPNDPSCSFYYETVQTGIAPAIYLCFRKGRTLFREDISDHYSW